MHKAAVTLHVDLSYQHQYFDSSSAAEGFSISTTRLNDFKLGVSITAKQIILNDFRFLQLLLL